MAWQEALEDVRGRSDAASLLRRRLAAMEAWRRAGWVMALVATVAASAVGVLALAATLAGGLPAGATLAARYGLPFLQAVLLAPLVALIPALGLFVFSWRRAPTAELIQRLAGIEDDELLTAAEAMDGRADLSGALGPLLQARALSVAEKLPVSALVWTAPWRVVLHATGAAVALLLLSLAFPPGWARLAGAGAPSALAASQATAPRATPEPPPATAAPSLAQFSMTLEPPAYTGLAAQKLDRPGPAQVPEGSTVRLQAQFADADEAALQWGRQEEKGGLRVEAVRRVARSLQWGLRAQGPGGRTKLGPFALGVLPDRKPQASFVQPRGEVVLERARAVPLQVQAGDDYGLARVSLQWRLGTSKDWRQVLVAHDCGRKYEGTVNFDLQPMKLLPGAEVVVRVVAEDNKKPGGPQRGFSPPLRLKIAVARDKAQQRPAEAVEQAAAREQDAWERLRRTMDQLGQQVEQLQRQVERQVEHGNSRGRGAGQQQAELADTAQRLEKAASDVKQAMAEAEQRLKLQDVVDEEMLEKVAELHKLASEVLDEQMKELLDRLREAMKTGDLSKLEADARKLRELHDRLMRKLDQTLELLKRAKMEMMLRALERRVKQLVDKQGQVSARTQKMPEGAPEARQEAQRQEELARQAGPLPDDMQLAAEQSKKLDAKTAEALEALAERLKRQDPAGKMRQAAQALRRAAPSDAKQPQSAALEALRQAAADLAGMQADLTGRQRRELQSAASRAVAEAVGLAQAQQQLSRQTEPLSREFLGRAVQQKQTLERLSANQKALADGAARLAEQLQQLAGKTPLAGPELAARMAAVGEQMQQAARSLQGGEGGMAQVMQQAALGQLNQLAADLAVLSQALGQQSAQMALSEYLKRLEQLAQQQRGLNELSQQMGNGNPRLSELGAQQAMLKAALDKLMRGAGRQLTDKLGGVGKDMDEVASDLKARRLTAKTKTRQRDLLHKMLDAQRSLYTRHQQSRERKAERPRTWKPAPSPPAVAVEGPPQLKLPEVETSQTEEVPPEYEDLAKEYLRRVRPQ